MDAFSGSLFLAVTGAESEDDDEAGESGPVRPTERTRPAHLNR